MEKANALLSQARWARFRFSIIGPLLSAPPQTGELRQALLGLSKKEWKHPITGVPVNFSFSTLERWFYRARPVSDPVNVLSTKHRKDAEISRVLNAEFKCAIQQQHREHPGWSYQLHRDNLVVRAKAFPALGSLPSYSTLRRYMKNNGFCKRRRVRNRQTMGAEIAEKRLEEREVRSFEVDYVHGLWHLDFHHGSRKILGKDGEWHKPMLLAIMDDCSRLVCHAQWYLHEDTESLVHGFMQALQKRALPRAVMSDNGSAMIAAEFTEGLERLSILHQRTLPYSPYQNAKQEVFWAQVEGRLMAMLESEPELTLQILNQATLAWVEMEYHRKVHAELKMAPLGRYMQGTQVGRDCPETSKLKQAFCMQVKRTQRKSDGTMTLEGRRFEVPSQYRHIESLHVRYARWDLSHAMLVEPKHNNMLAMLYPQDKSANASGLRRKLPSKSEETNNKSPEGIAPLLKALMSEYAATGLPPAYLPKGENDE
jgi:putative transposase